MAGGGSTEMKALEERLGVVERLVFGLQRQVAGLQAALRGGDVVESTTRGVAESTTRGVAESTTRDVAPASGGKPAPVTGGSSVPGGPARVAPRKGKS